MNVARLVVCRCSPFSIKCKAYCTKNVVSTALSQLFIRVSNMLHKINQHDPPRCRIVPGLCPKRHNLVATRSPDSGDFYGSSRVLKIRFAEERLCLLGGYAVGNFFA
jgi:hypothetical protein